MVCSHHPTRLRSVGTLFLVTFLPHLFHRPPLVQPFFYDSLKYLHLTRKFLDLLPQPFYLRALVSQGSCVAFAQYPQLTEQLLVGR
jgi:hypothetical protein